ncbi:hypothetical protein STEG23_018572, partial [Scotinomys teguina]
MLTANPRTEKVETDAAKSTIAFPGVDSTTDTEPDGERLSEKQADNAQNLVANPDDILNIDPTAESLLGDLKVTEFGLVQHVSLLSRHHSEMTMATQEPDTTLSLVAQRHIEVPRGSGEPEEEHLMGAVYGIRDTGSGSQELIFISRRHRANMDLAS